MMPLQVGLVEIKIINNIRGVGNKQATLLRHISPHILKTFIWGLVYMGSMTTS